MKFGQVENAGEIDFTLPPDHKDTTSLLKKGKQKLDVYVGCAKWNKTDLKNFYPKGTKDELTYYATQFNSIELNATFYSIPSKEQVLVWKDKTPEGFKFFPKISNTISHFRRLQDVKTQTEQFCEAISMFEEKLGMVFLQLHDNYMPKDLARLVKFLDEFPKGIPLAIELRNANWFADTTVANEITSLMADKKLANIIVDTAGRRDMLHMRLTSSTAFIRYVGANHESDYKRLDEWVERLKIWQSQGLENLYFFVHQNIELASPLLSAYFIEKINSEMGLNLSIPAKENLVKGNKF